MTDSFTPATAGFASRSLPETRQDGSLAGWFAALAEGDATSHRYLLLLRFTVLNLVAGALLGAAWLKGWVGAVLDGDSTRLVLVIAAVFLFGLFGCGRRIWQTSLEINQLKGPRGVRDTRIERYLAGIAGRGGHGRALAASALKLKLAARISSIRHLANSLVFLGLIGTVVGFIIALSGVDVGRGRRRGDRADGLDPDRRHVGRPVHHPGRRDPEHLVDDQLSPAGERHDHPGHRDRRGG